MFLVLPSLAVIAIYIIAAILPALFLMRYIYRKDTIEKEPPQMLVSLVFLGVAAALVAIVLESIGKGILAAFIAEDSPAYTIIMAFLVVAVVEEAQSFSSSSGAPGATRISTIGSTASCMRCLFPSDSRRLKTSVT